MSSVNEHNIGISQSFKIQKIILKGPAISWEIPNHLISFLATWPAPPPKKHVVNELS